MARPLRIEFPNAIYHVTSRGSERRPIVADERDRRRWLDRLRHTVEARRWRLFAFALMNNHFHLFVETREANLSAGMHDLNGGHVNYFNARHARSGHLFEGRFKAVLVESEGHWLEVSRYVHLNPVRAGLAATPEAWACSSYPGYYRPARRVPWVNYARVLEEFGGDTSAGRRRYREFVADGLGRELNSPLASAWHGLVLGSDRFLARVRTLVSGRADDPEVPDLSRLRARPSLGAVVEAVARHYSVEPSDWAPGRRCNGVARAVAACLGRRLAGASSRELADALGYRNPSSISVACRRVERAPKGSPVHEGIRLLTGRLLQPKVSDLD